MIYVDNNATTAVAPEVRDVMLPFFNELYYNPSSMYPPAQNVAKEVKKARQTIAQCLDIEDPSEILFTSCASESNNAAIFGCAAANLSKRHIITTSVEHPAVLEVCKEMERRGYRVTYLKVNNLGELDMREYVRALDEDTLIVSIMHANNETGVVFPVEDLARIAKETDPAIIFHTDATQTMTKLPLNYQSGLFDLVSFSGHKFHAPKGVGGLYIRKGTRIRPFLIGGHQENGRRAGTENVAYIVGMAEAMKLAARTHAADSERIRRMRARFENTLLERIPYIEINGRGATRMPNTSNVAVHCIEGEAILYQLSEAGICASSGSACTSGSLESSHVLRAMNVPFTAMHGSTRFSFSRYNTEEEIAYITDVFPKIVERLRNMSPYWDKTNQCPIVRN